MTDFGKVSDANRVAWGNEGLRAVREAYFTKQFLSAFGPESHFPRASTWKRAWWRVRSMLRSFVYIECECGSLVNRWTGSTH